jgi:hypothetical protein
MGHPKFIKLDASRKFYREDSKGKLVLVENSVS